MISVTRPCSTSHKIDLTDNGTGRKFEYDAWNRMTRVLDGTSAELVRYEFDALSRRHKRFEGTTETRYVYDGPRLLEEYVNPGTGVFALATRYIYGGGLDELIAIETGGQRYYTYRDALGSIEAITDSAGVVVERYDYDAFGVPTVTDGLGVPTPLGIYGEPTSQYGNDLWFTGARWDPESGNYHMRARQYEPLAGRFVSRDPLGYVDGPNAYSYGYSDPANWTDPFGLEAGGSSGGNNPFLGTAMPASFSPDDELAAPFLRSGLTFGEGYLLFLDAGTPEFLVQAFAHLTDIGGNMFSDEHVAYSDVGRESSARIQAGQSATEATLNIMPEVGTDALIDIGLVAGVGKILNVAAPAVRPYISRAFDRAKPYLGKLKTGAGKCLSWAFGKSARKSLKFGANNRKLDFLFNKNINQDVVRSAQRARGNGNRIGIADTPANRANVIQRFNDAFNDPSTIVGPGRTPGSNLHEFFLPGLTGTGSKVQFVELAGNIITIMAK